METRTAGSDSVPPGLQPHPKAMLLGLPCAHCKAYFAADLEVCPICGCNERVVIGRRAAKVVVMRSESSVSAGSARFNPQQNGCMAVLPRLAGLALASEKDQLFYSEYLRQSDTP